MDALCFEDLKIGDSWTTPRRTVTETDVVNFAGITGDYNALHCDHEFAAASTFRRPIAHGLLGLSWVAGLGFRSPSVDTIAFCGIENWQFLKPVHIGDTIYARWTVADKGKPGRKSGAIRWRNQLLNSSNMLLQQGDFTTLVRVQENRKREAA